MGSILSNLKALKTARAAEIVDWLQEVANVNQGNAQKIRLILSPGSNGSKQIFPATNSDIVTVQIALLAILVDEISYAPTAPQRATGLREAELAAASLKISYEDVVRSSRQASALVSAFE